MVTCATCQSGETSKVHKPWQGSYTVVKVLSNVTYKIQSESGRDRQVVHFDRLKLCSTQLTKGANNAPTELSPSENWECDMTDEQQTDKNAADKIIGKKRSTDATMELYTDHPR